ncbi:MAG TPA: hypothetical protein VI461_17365, partial [Chitinophagaceae bacterium]|nr:hypothetical protein [Chitinophagaceae bacterium]
AFSPRSDLKSSIYGTIDPPDGAQKIWAINGTDSFSAVPVMGKFSLDVKPGNWALKVVAIKPYKDAIVENILVQENQSTDAGVIKLQE